MKSIFSIFVMALAFITMPTLSVMAENPTLPAKAPNAQDTCSIKGTIVEVEEMVVPQYSETPSIFNHSYQRLSIRVLESDVHEKYSGGFSSHCDNLRRGRTAYFKLCSTVTPKTGDSITGITGHPENNREDSCLFDIEIHGNIINPD